MHTRTSIFASTAALALCSLAHARQFPSPVTLPDAVGVENLVITPSASYGEFGKQPAPVGDLNGDGRVDFAIGVPEHTQPGDTFQRRGACYVFFGSPEWASGTSFDTSTLDGQRGFVIYGEAVDDNLGSRVAAAGDVNGDGYDDLAISASRAAVGGAADRGCIYVLFGGPNLGAGGVISATDISGVAGFRIFPPLTEEVYSYELPDIAGIGDVDGDGFDDLAVSKPGYGQADRVIPLGPDETRSITAGDIDGDGLGDFIVSQSYLQRVLVFRNQGNGFTMSSMAVPFPTKILLRDLNGDGLPDLLASTYNAGQGGVSIYLNTFGGTLGNGVHHWLPKLDVHFAVGDFDNDGDPDIAVSNSDGENNGPESLHFLVNNGAGGFAPGSILSVVNNPSTLEAADVDGDGDIDLMLDVDYAGVLQFLENTGSGQFAPAVSSPNGYDYLGLLLADFDGDGDLDAVRTRTSGLHYTENAGAGVFLAPVNLGVGNWRGQVVTDDIDGDGDLDLLSCMDSNALIVRRNNGDGTFSLPEEIEQDALGGYSLALTDVDGDGDRDVVIAARVWLGDYRICVARSFGDGAFTGSDSGMTAVLRGGPAIQLGDPYDLDSSPSSAWFTIKGRHGNERLGSSLSGLGDLDGDGYADFAIGAEGAWEPGFRTHGGYYVVRGAPALGASGQLDVHSFSGPDGFAVGNTSNGATIGVQRLHAADFDNDGRTDLVAPYGGGAVVLFGSQTLGASGLENLAAPNGMHSYGIWTAQPGDQVGLHPIAAGDVNGDGYDDVLLGAPYYSEGLSARGAVFGVFGGPRPLSPPQLSMAGMSESQGFRMLGDAANRRIAHGLAVVGDVDGDGIEDFVVSDSRALSFSGRAHLILGQRYGPPSSYCSSQPNSLGCVPEIHWSGDLASVSDTDSFHVRASSVVNRKSGLLFYGKSGRTSVPFLGGELCVASPLSRTPPQLSNGSLTGADCTGSFDLDWTGWMASGADAGLLAGVTVNCQYWSRDPQATSRTNLTNGLEFTIGP